MNKVLCTEMLFDCVYKCMQVVGVNSVDRKHMFERYLREASILPLYDAGNFGMQRRRIHGVMAHSSFDPGPSWTTGRLRSTRPWKERTLFRVRVQKCLDRGRRSRWN